MWNKKSGKDEIKSLNKALDLLEFLSENVQEIGVGEISKKINMGLSTTYRILQTFKSRGYILQNQKTLKYKLGIKVFELGYNVQNTKSLIQIVRPYLRKLSKISNETANLAIIEGIDVVYLDTIESSEILRTGILQGTRLPAHCTALGKVLLSYLSNNDLMQLYKNNELSSLTSQSITSFTILTKELRKIKENGYAFDKEEFMVGINCVAVPIFNKSKEAIAAISTTGPSSRFTLEMMKNAKNILKNMSKEISKTI